MPDTKVQSHTARIELPPVFTGDETEDFGQWCRRLEVAVKASSEFTSIGHAQILPIRLGGQAFAYWDSLEDSLKADYESVKAKLKDVFRKRNFITTFQTYINARPRAPHEPLEVYRAEIIRLVNEAFPDYDTKAKEGESFRRFVAGLDEYLQLKVHEAGSKTLDDALVVATRVERAHEASKIKVPLQNISG